jgi:5-methyltetrahydrofolate--homocysteine methyltransferase
MTETLLSSASREVCIGFDRPFVIIGERINPTGRKILAEEMKNGDFSRVEADAIAQVAAGAHMLDVNAVTGEEECLEVVLPLVAKHGAAVVAITNDETGISEDPDCRQWIRKYREPSADGGARGRAGRERRRRATNDR